MPMRNLEQYKIFAAVARTRSFSGAAKQLYISQPAVSQSVKSLEEELGFQLFLRTPKGVKLTSEGEMLYGYIHSAFNLIASGEDRLEGMRRMQAGELRIGAGDTLTKYILIDCLHRFHSRYPDIRLSVVNRTTPQTLQMLKAGELDLAVCNLPVDCEGVESAPCMRVQDVFVAGTRFGHLFGRRVPLAELARQPLIMLESASNSRQFVERFFTGQGVLLTPEIELGAYDLLFDFAGIGLGVSCVIEEFSRELIDRHGLCRVQLAKKLPARDVGICRLSGIPLSIPAQKFADMLLRSCKEPVAGPKGGEGE